MWFYIRKKEDWLYPRRMDWLAGFTGTLAVEGRVLHTGASPFNMLP